MATEALFLAGEPGQVLGVTGVLREAFKIPRRNGELAVSVVLLLLFPCIVLNLTHDLAMGRRINALVDDDSDENPPTTQRDLGIFVCLESVFFLAWCLISFMAMSLTMCASAMTYTGRHLSVKQAVLRIAITWRKLACTWISVAVITMAYALIAFLLLITVGNTLAAFMGSFAALFYVYLAVIWKLGFAISIVEENCFGMDAIRRALKIIQGKKVHGFLLMLLLILLGFPFYLLLIINTIEDDQGMVVRVAVGTASAAIACLVKIFSYVVFTVFYYQCSKEDEEGVEMDGTEGVCLLPNIAPVNNTLP